MNIVLRDVPPAIKVAELLEDLRTRYGLTFYCDRSGNLVGRFVRAHSANSPRCSPGKPAAG